MNDMNAEGRAFGWDDEFTNEQQEFKSEAKRS